tara:strand:- start:191 stop:433 length:243 start_codon:yes stop_codon:yes gene_type:complete
MKSGDAGDAGVAGAVISSPKAAGTPETASRNTTPKMAKSFLIILPREGVWCYFPDLEKKPPPRELLPERLPDLAVDCRDW